MMLFRRKYKDSSYSAIDGFLAQNSFFLQNTKLPKGREEGKCSFTWYQVLSKTGIYFKHPVSRIT